MTPETEEDVSILTENEDNPLKHGFNVIRVAAGGFLISRWCPGCATYHPFDVAYDAQALFGVMEFHFFGDIEPESKTDGIDDGSSNSRH